MGAAPEDDLDAALFAWEHAPRLCRPVGPGGGCAPYHRLVQYLRLLGVVVSPARHAGFVAPAIAAAVDGARRPRVLIGGAADQAMLATVLRAFDGIGAAPRVTVLDRCPTPLAVCERHAAEHGLDTGTALGDAAEHDAGGVDVICSDSLLVMLPDEHKRRVVARWGAALRRGGSVITNLRIGRRTPGAHPDRGADRAAAFARWARERAEGRPDLPLEPAAVEAAARAYATSLTVYPVDTLEQFTGLFEEAGFEIAEVDVVVHEGPVPPAAAGPGSATTATYALVRAVAP